MQEQDNSVVNEFINNKTNKEAALLSAHQIQKEFGNWFTVPQLIKKFKIDKPNAAAKIEMLMLFNICIGKVEKKIPYFKIDIDQRTQRKLISEEILIKEGEILFLKEKLSKLN